MIQFGQAIPTVENPVFLNNMDFQLSHELTIIALKQNALGVLIKFQHRSSFRRKLAAGGVEVGVGKAKGRYSSSTVS
jgi:hypothetical protein